MERVAHYGKDAAVEVGWLLLLLVFSFWLTWWLLY